MLARLTRIETRSQAIRLTALYAFCSTCVSALASACIAFTLGHPPLPEMLTGASIAAVITPAMTWPLAIAALRLSERERALELQANTDALTGVFNRRGFFAAAVPIFAAAPGVPICAMLIDLDGFKHVNDTYGHAAGDKVVAAVAQSIRAVADPYGGLVARLGGDEFGVIVPGVDAASLQALSERLRVAVETRLVQHGGRTIRVTASVGAAPRRACDATLDDLLARADVALYAAKSMGRNRIVDDAPALRRSA